MATTPGQCPFLIPVVADTLWVWPVPAVCRRPDTRVKVPSRETLMRVCMTSGHPECPGFHTREERQEGLGGSGA